MLCTELDESSIRAWACYQHHAPPGDFTRQPFLGKLPILPLPFKSGCLQKSRHRNKWLWGRVFNVWQTFDVLLTFLFRMISGTISQSDNWQLWERSRGISPLGLCIAIYPFRPTMHHNQIRIIELAYWYIILDIIRAFLYFLWTKRLHFWKSAITIYPNVGIFADNMIIWIALWENFPKMVVCQT